MHRFQNGVDGDVLIKSPWQSVRGFTIKVKTLVRNYQTPRLKARFVKNKSFLVRAV
ncbi:MAG: hypothetical protein ACI9C4_001954 [Paraglaciecola sp.]